MKASGRLDRIRSFDVSYTYSLSDSVIMSFIETKGKNLHGAMMGGKPKLDEHFWLAAVPLLPNIR